MFNCICDEPILIFTRPVESLNIGNFIQLDQLKISYISYPLTDIHYYPITKHLNYNNFIITSANAVNHQLSFIDKKANFYCVGTKAGEKLNNLGFQNIHNLGKDIEEFYINFNKIAEQKEQYLYLRASEVTKDLSLLMPNIHSEIAYSNIPLRNINSNMLDLLQNNQLKCITLFSALNAQLWLNLLDTYHTKINLDNIVFLCLSSKIANILKVNITDRKIFIADSPNLESLLNKFIEIKSNYGR